MLMQASNNVASYKAIECFPWQAAMKLCCSSAGDESVSEENFEDVMIKTILASPGALNPFV